MSGSGRKSNYRKSVTSKFLDSEDFDLEEGDEVGKVTANLGTNTFSLELSNGTSVKAKLPNKFHKMIWVKTRDFVVINTMESSGEGDMLVIKHILSKDSIKYLRKTNQFPECFDNNPVTITNNRGREMPEMPSLDDPEEEEEEEYEEEEPQQPIVSTNESQSNEPI